MQRYDKAEYEERLETAQLIGDISQNQIDIQWTPKVREAEANRQQAEAVLNNQNATTAEKAEARQIKSQSEQIINTYGKGGDYQLAVRAVTGVLQGLATGNQNAAWVNGLSPYANNLIKTYTTDESGQVNTTANLMAHAMLGALEAYATGNHAAAGAAGAITSEVAAKLITEQLYHTEPDKLTDDQKQVVATLSQVTAGLAGIVTSDSTQSAVSAAEIGKRAVENNELFGYSADTLTGLAMKARADAVIAPIEQQANEQVQEIATKLAEFGVDMTPLLGDGKAFYDAEDGIDYILATIGVLPGADAITKPLKEAKDLYQAAKKAKAAGAFEEAVKYQNLANSYTSSSLEYIYTSKEVRNALENKYGKANVISTTVPPGNAKNVKLAGQRHPITGVPFDEKGFPIFDDIAKYDTKLDVVEFKNISYQEQMKMATKQLYQELGDKGLKIKGFDNEQITAIKNGNDKIPGFTWHHHQDTGRMQLIPEWEHSQTGHIGGNSIQKGK
ncbi:VENN motif pre-toxin domain-containing protein [Exercitatus varius]|uniref:VENN motif pre-toxin domain-containing protein n=1 Tax=Exercitatus varius TaxID=67857 RepID=UPI00294AA6F6|nr:HNH endonuclease [Exercitatus varius]MDG2944687.1 HNH endonuclease [Exercitatus varius]